MARQPMVTRTIPATEVNVLCINPETKEVFELKRRVPRTYKTTEKLMKAVEAVMPEGIKAVQILEKRVTTNLYGMDEATFISNAQLLPDRNTVKSDKAANEEGSNN